MNTAFKISFFLSVLMVNTVSVANSLSHFDWQRRIVIVSVNSSEELNAIERLLKANKEQLGERKLKLFLTGDSTVKAYPSEDDIYTLSSNSLQERLKGNKALLIGLDGADKAAYNTFNLSEIFKDIDGMPMRQAELINENLN